MAIYCDSPETYFSHTEEWARLIQIKRLGFSSNNPKEHVYLLFCLWARYTLPGFDLVAFFDTLLLQQKIRLNNGLGGEYSADNVKNEWQKGFKSDSDLPPNICPPNRIPQKLLAPWILYFALSLRSAASFSLSWHNCLRKPSFGPISRFWRTVERAVFASMLWRSMR